ncbi:MAG: hypothetical protein HY909_04615 [Deltaproteobacteria bacterium]|nr:hypothetical protein [Deltaproteobacteria bacterium]
MDTTQQQSPFSFFTAFPAMPLGTFGAVPFGAVMEPWRRAMTDGVERMRAFYGEAARLEGLSQAQAMTAVDESARLAREFLAYQTQLQAAWRQRSLEACKGMADAFAAPGAAATGTP